MVTIRDVAKKAGVSVATVSATINDSAFVSPELRTRVERARTELDYHPDGIARSLRIRTSQTVGLIISDITNPFFTALVRGVEDTAQARGYAVTLCNTDESLEKERAYTKLLRSRRVDGLIMAPAGALEDYQRFVATNVPLVFVDRHVPTAAVDSVVVDNVDGARQLVQYLIQLGHRRIGIIVGLPQISTSRDRLEGYRQALEAARVPVDPALQRMGFSSSKGAYTAGLSLLSLNPPPTAIFAGNNLMVIGLMWAVAERGIECPADLSVACFDDFEWASVFRPRLTVVAQPTYEMGAKAAELLFERLTNAYTGEPRQIVFSPRFIIRDSCASPSGGC